MRTATHRPRSAHWAFALLLAATCLLPAHAARLALVIGNKDYAASPLKNPLNDAEAMAAALGGGNGGLGFKVTLVRNLRRDDIGRTVEAFANTIRPGDDVVVFYAGHGLQVKGVNYLPAVDARIQVESDVALNSLNLNDLLQRLDEAKAGVRLLLIDACRDNPYSRGFRSSARGLARVEGAPSGTLMHFATRPGSVADDGQGNNGLYTSELLKHLRTPGLPVESMLKRVASGVRQASSGNQQPWTEGALDGEFFFAGSAVVPPPAPQQAAGPAPSTQPRPAPTTTAQVPVTAPAPSPAATLIDGRYQVLGDGSEVKDVQTGLVWARCSVGQTWDAAQRVCSGEPKQLTWDESNQYLEASNKRGDLWRIPNLRELYTLIRCVNGKSVKPEDIENLDIEKGICNTSQSNGPPLPNLVFPDVGSAHWTSTELSAGPTFDRILNFFEGGKPYPKKNKVIHSSFFATEVSWRYLQMSPKNSAGLLLVRNY